ncbi:MAG: hypothetical protein HY874_05055, partial [Chloroflexi bacterium]|nr:hypothetical protein [Chloroflexota bacterium]
GTKLGISDKHLTFKLRGAAEQRISVYRLRMLERVPDHMAAGYAAAASAPADAAAEAPAPSVEDEAAASVPVEHAP